MSLPCNPGPRTGQESLWKQGVSWPTVYSRKQETLSNKVFSDLRPLLMSLGVHSLALTHTSIHTSEKKREPNSYCDSLILPLISLLASLQALGTMGLRP